MESLLISLLLLTIMTILTFLLMFVWFAVVTTGLLLCANSRSKFFITILVCGYFFYYLFDLVISFL